MGTAYEAQDALGMYQTSPEDSADIYEPDQSLGGALINREVPVLEWDFDPSQTIPQVVILSVSGANGTGSAAIRAASSTTLAYTAPGSTEGTAVTVADGATVTLIDGTTASKYIRVMRDGSDNLAGRMPLDLVEPYSTTLAGPAISASTGDYQGIMLRNRAASNAITDIKFWLAELGTAQVSGVTQLGGAGAGTIVTAGSFSTWPTSGAVYIEDNLGALKEIAWYASRTSTTLTVAATNRALLGTSATAGAATDTVRAIPAIAFGLETPDANGRIQEIANTSTAPSGVTFYKPVTEAAALTLSTLAAGAVHGLWIWLHKGGAGGSNPAIQIKINRKNTINAVTYSDVLYARYRTGGTPAFYSLYAGVDALPDFTAAATATSTTSPITYALTPPGAGTREYRLAVRYTDAYGLQSVNQDVNSITIDSTGAVATSDLQIPVGVTLTDKSGGVVNVKATYYKGVDTTNADYWKIYYRVNGTDPVPASDSPITEAMTTDYAFPNTFVLDYDFPTQEYGTDLRVIVRAYRSSDTKVSNNTTATTIIVGTALPLQPASRAVTLGSAWGVDLATIAYDSTYTIPGTSSLAYIKSLLGETQFWFNSEMVLRIVFDSTYTEGNRCYILNSWALLNTTQGAAGAATWYEVLSWTGGDKRVSVNVNSTRQLIFDVTNKNIICGEFQFPGASALSGHPNPTNGVWSNSTATMFHVLDAASGTWKPWSKVTSGGVWDVQVAIDQMRA